MGVSVSFAISGLSFALAKKMLTYGKKQILSKTDKKPYYLSKYAEVEVNFHTGIWLNSIDEEIIDYMLKAGETQLAPVIFGYVGLGLIEKGNFAETQQVIGRLNEIANEYNDLNAKITYYWAKAVFLVKKRQINEAFEYVDKMHALCEKLGERARVFVPLGLKIYTLVLQNDYKNAELTIEKAKHNVSSEYTYTPFMHAYFLLGLFSFHLAKLEIALTSKENENLLNCQKVSFKIGKELIAISKKTAWPRIEAFRLMGKLCWITNKQKTALKLWTKAINEGKRLGALPEKARVMMEIGKGLLEERKKYPEFNGMRAEEYLEKAKSIFEELDLQWDLDELHKILAVA